MHVAHTLMYLLGKGIGQEQLPPTLQLTGVAYVRHAKVSPGVPGPTCTVPGCPQ